MKRQKRTAALLPLLLLALLLAGCTPETQASAPPAVSGGSAAPATERAAEAVSTESQSWTGEGGCFAREDIYWDKPVLDLCVYDGVVYAITQGELTWNVIDLTGGTVLYTSPLLLTCIAASPAGLGIIAVQEGNDPETGTYYTDQLLVSLSFSGALLREQNVSAIAGSQNSVVCLCYDAQGNTYLDFNGFVGVLDAQGAWLGSVVPESGILLKLLCTGDGQAAVLIREDGATRLYFLTGADVDAGSALTLAENPDAAFSGGGGYTALLLREKGLYGLGGDGSETLIFSFAECGIVLSLPAALCCLNETDFICLENQSAFAIAAADPSQVQSRTALTLAALVSPVNITGLVDSFNRASNTCFVEIVDYYSGTRSVADAVTRLNTELLSGQGPDLIYFGNYSPKSYIQKGYLVDLYPYLDADEALSRDDFLILVAMETDGGLYTAAPSFTITTLAGKASEFGDAAGWDFDDLYALLSSPEAGAGKFPSWSNTGFLSDCLDSVLPTAIDWAAGTCDFDTEAFRALLTAAAAFPDPAEETLGSDFTSAEALLQRGDALVIYETLTSITDLVRQEEAVGESLALIGFPTADGTGGSQINLTANIGISSQSGKADAAWSFLRYMMADETYQNSISSAFPMLRSALESDIEALLHPHAELADAEFVPGENGGVYIDGVFHDIVYDPETFFAPLATQEQVDKVMALIEGGSHIYSYELDVQNIILEEAAAYFAGDRSLDDTIALIQNRAGLYVAEQS